MTTKSEIVRPTKIKIGEDVRVLTERQSDIVSKMEKGFKLAYCRTRDESWYCLINSMDEFVNVRPDVARGLIAKHIVVFHESDAQETDYVLNPCMCIEVERAVRNGQ